MPKFVNNASGPRGVNLNDGTTVFVEAGATSDDIKDADISHVHEDLEPVKAGKKVASEAPDETA